MQIDLLINEQFRLDEEWSLGNIRKTPLQSQMLKTHLIEWGGQSKAEYGLIWTDESKLPSQEVITSLIKLEVDIAHSGLSSGIGNWWPDLAMISQNWSMINAPIDIPSTSWRLDLRHCLIKRSTWVGLMGIDPAYTTLEAAGLDLGYRALKLGAIVEHRPELIPSDTQQIDEPPAQDLYVFVYRHYGSKWTKYLCARRSLKNFQLIKERKAMLGAIRSCIENPRPPMKPVERSGNGSNAKVIEQVAISVILPTLGRYDYLPRALESLRDQTVKPNEVIVIDQNPKQKRKPELYEPFTDLNLKIIWQDEQGQSLARNTGLKHARGEYVFLFDDDSIAYPDLIEQHLIPISNGPFDVSTGVALPPPPTDYQLPDGFSYPRLAQTFDTGNALLRKEVLLRLGGFDRHYDFGPGTDSDLGTRLYLSGYRILHNPRAIRLHFKAPSGGLRTHGAQKYNTDPGIFAPFPPVTRSYYSYRFLTRHQRREIVFLTYVLNKYPGSERNSVTQKMNPVFIYLKILAMLLLLPLKRYRSEVKARKYLKIGPRMM